MFLVPTGTAANALALSVLTPPWGAVLCHAQSHIHIDECGAPEFFTHGAKLVLLEGEQSKICPKNLAKIAAPNTNDVHTVQNSVVSISQTTETGSVYSLAQLSEISRICKQNGLKFCP